MGGQPKQTQEQSTTTVMPPEQQQNVNTLLRGARDYYGTGGPQYFGGQTYAGPTGNELTGRTMAGGYATGAGTDFVKGLQGGESFFLNPNNIFNPSNIPGFRAATEGVTRDVNRNLTESMLPAIAGGNIASGSLGGSRREISKGLAVGRSSEALSDALAKMNMDAYGQGLNMYNSAANRAPTTYGLGLAPSQTLQDIGGMERADQQQGIDADIKRFNFEQLRPLLNLQMLQGLTGTAGTYGGTTNSTGTMSQGGGGSGLMTGIGGLLTLASMFGGGP